MTSCSRSPRSPPRRSWRSFARATWRQPRTCPRHTISPSARPGSTCAQGDPAAALAVLEPYRRRMAEKAWADQELMALVLLAVALDARGERARAVELLDEALTLGRAGRLHPHLRRRGCADGSACSTRRCSRGVHQGYVRQLLATYPVDGPDEDASPRTPAAGIRLAEPLSARELEVLRLIAEGLTNQEIAVRLYLSLHTVKAHARTIYAKLGVSSRTQAAAKGRALGLLPLGPPPRRLIWTASATMRAGRGGPPAGRCPPSRAPAISPRIPPGRYDTHTVVGTRCLVQTTERGLARTGRSRHGAVAADTQGRTAMTSSRRTAAIVGLLFLTATVYVHRGRYAHQGGSGSPELPGRCFRRRHRAGRRRAPRIRRRPRGRGYRGPRVPVPETHQ